MRSLGDELVRRHVGARIGHPVKALAGGLDVPLQDRNGVIVGAPFAHLEKRLQHPLFQFFGPDAIRCAAKRIEQPDQLASAMDPLDPVTSRQAGCRSCLVA